MAGGFMNRGADAGDEIERLVITIVGNHAPYLGSLIVAHKKTAEWAAQMEGTVGTRAASAFYVLAHVAVGAAVAIERSWRRVSGTIENTIDTAKRLGVSSQFLTTIHHAGIVSGETPAQVDSALTTMTKNIHRAGAGAASGAKGRGLAGAFAQAGLDPAQLQGMGAQQQFALIAAQLNKITNVGQRTALAMRILGGQGAKMLSLNLAAASREAERFGLIFTDLEGNRIKKAREEIRRLQEAISGVSTQISIAAAPSIEGWAKSLTEATAAIARFTRDYRGMAEVISTTVMTLAGFAALLVAIAFGANLLMMTINGLALAIPALMAALAGLAAVVAFLGGPATIIAVLGGLAAGLIWKGYRARQPSSATPAMTGDYMSRKEGRVGQDILTELKKQTDLSKQALENAKKSAMGDQITTVEIF